MINVERIKMSIQCFPCACFNQISKLQKEFVSPLKAHFKRQIVTYAWKKLGASETLP